MKKKAMLFHLSDKLKLQLILYAAKEGVTQTQVIRTALTFYFEYKQKETLK